MTNDQSLPYELKMYFEGKTLEVAYAMNPQQLMCIVFHQFENFSNDLMLIHSEYNQAGQLCNWELSYSKELHHRRYPQVAGEPELKRATIRNIVWTPVETYALRKDIEIPNRRYVWACVENGIVTDWRDFEHTDDKELRLNMRRAMNAELGKENALVKSGMVKGRTLHIVKPPSHMRNAGKSSAKSEYSAS